MRLPDVLGRRDGLLDSQFSGLVSERWKTVVEEGLDESTLKFRRRRRLQPQRHRSFCFGTWYCLVFCPTSALMYVG